MNKLLKIIRVLIDVKDSLNLLPSNCIHSKFYCFFDMIFCVIRYGALPEDYISLKFCNRNHVQRKLFITQGNKRVFKKVFYTPEALNILTQKNEFYKLFKNFVTRDWIYSKDYTKEQITAFIHSHSKVIIKPISSTCGKGIDVLSQNTADIDKLANGEYMIEEVLVNHPALAALNPSSLQTLRVETCIDSKGELHLLNVLLMMGTKNVIVSNCHSGGCMAHINIENGKVDRPAWNPSGWECSVHPSSHINLIGYEIPMMDKLYDYIKKVAFVLPEARYVGWDVTITDKCAFELIEGNYCSGHCTQTCDEIPKFQMLKSFI